MRLFIDECLSPRMARALNETGRHVAVHPRDHGGVGEPDYKVLARCIAEDLIIVTENARDFRKLVRRAEVHPGLIVLPNVGRRQAEDLLSAVLTYLEQHEAPMAFMINKVVEVAADGEFELFTLP